MRRRPLVICAVIFTAVVSLAACTGKDAVSNDSTGAYRFSGATAKGTVIVAADRKPVGTVSATLLDGTSFTFTSTAGKVTLVNFYASWCVPCQSETPQLAALYTEMQSTGVDFVGVATKDTSKSAAADFSRDEGVTYPVVYDQSAKMPLQMGNIPLIGLPMTVILDKQHRVAAVYPTIVLPADLRPTLNSLLAEA